MQNCGYGGWSIMDLSIQWILVSVGGVRVLLEPQIPRDDYIYSISNLYNTPERWSPIEPILQIRKNEAHGSCHLTNFT